MCKNINPMQIFLFDTLSDNGESIDIRPYSLSAQLLKISILINIVFCVCTVVPCNTNILNLIFIKVVV